MNTKVAKPFEFITPTSNQAVGEMSVEPETTGNEQIISHAAVSTIITLTQSLFGKHIRILMVAGDTAKINDAKVRFKNAMLEATMGEVGSLIELFTFLSSLNLTLKD